MRFHFLASPVACEGEGCVEVLVCQQMELGPPDESGRRSPVALSCEPFRLTASTIIAAVGQQPDFSPFAVDPALTLNKWGYLEADPHTGMTAQARGLRRRRRGDRRRLGDRGHQRRQGGGEVHRRVPAGRAGARGPGGPDQAPGGVPGRAAQSVRAGACGLRSPGADADARARGASDELRPHRTGVHAPRRRSGKPAVAYGVTGRSWWPCRAASGLERRGRGQASASAGCRSITQPGSPLAWQARWSHWRGVLAISSSMPRSTDWWIVHTVGRLRVASLAEGAVGQPERAPAVDRGPSRAACPCPRVRRGTAATTLRVVCRRRGRYLGFARSRGPTVRRRRCISCSLYALGAGEADGQFGQHLVVAGRQGHGHRVGVGAEGQLRTSDRPLLVQFVRNDQTCLFELVEVNADGAVVHAEHRHQVFDREGGRGIRYLAEDGEPRILAERLADLEYLWTHLVHAFTCSLRFC